MWRTRKPHSALRCCADLSNLVRSPVLLLASGPDRADSLSTAMAASPALPHCRNRGRRGAGLSLGNRHAAVTRLAAGVGTERPSRNTEHTADRSRILTGGGYS